MARKREAEEHHRECEVLREQVAALFIRDGKTLDEQYRRLCVLKARLRSRKPGVAESVRLIDVDVT